MWGDKRKSLVKVAANTREFSNIINPKGGCYF
jgi:hypothetical protein